MVSTGFPVNRPVKTLIIKPNAIRDKRKPGPPEFQYLKGDLNNVFSVSVIAAVD